MLAGRSYHTHVVLLHFTIAPDERPKAGTLRGGFFFQSRNVNLFP